MAYQAPKLSDRMFKRFCDLVYARAGIRLGQQKEALVAARVGKRIRMLGLSKYEEYFDLLEKGGAEAESELVEFLNAISTNVTHFFREKQHFEFLAKVLKRWEEGGQTRFRLWSAASSTGEEPYTMAMTVRAAIPRVSDCKILGTDLSTRVLQVARQGVYSPTHLEKVPESYVRRFFRREYSEEQLKYVVSDELRSMVKFARLNLAEPPFPMKGPFDVVFCRNVMIYFDNIVRKGLLDEIKRLLKPGGYLMVGHSESLSGILSGLKTVQPSIYIK